MDENENRKWHCPEGDKLWADLDTDAARIEFLESGQAINTGIIAPSMIAEIVSVFRRVETAESDLAEAEKIKTWCPHCGVDCDLDEDLSCTCGAEAIVDLDRVQHEHALREKAEADLAERACEWEEYEGMWRPGCCGETWEFTDGGPRENAVTHCMFCGGPMILVTGKDGG